MRGGAVLKGELMGYTERLNVGCERQRKLRVRLRFFAKKLEEESRQLMAGTFLSQFRWTQM